MAMTMADNVIRKACDRCHSQKLSCKRVGDEACERCVRLHAECKSSPSLRYKKQQQQQQQQQHQPQQQLQHQQQHQPQQPLQHQQHQQQHQQQQVQQHQQSHQQHPIAGPQTVVVGRRSPKRRRTGSELNLLQPEAGLITPQTADVASSSHHSVVGPEPSLELGDFDFDFEQLAFLTPPQPDALTHPILSGAVDAFQVPTTYTEPWEQQLAPSADPFPQITAPSAFPTPSSSHFHRVVPTVAPRRRPGAPEHAGVDTRRQRQRAKPRPRQIALRHAAHAPTQSREAPAIHWMAQLSDINARLLDLSSVLPQQQRQQQAPAACNGRPSDAASGFPIDEMFKLTRCVADILDRLSGTGDEGRLDGSNPGNSMFVLSTYVRLLDMYQRVFNLVRVELAQADARRAAFATWKLPDVTVGSFAVESTPSLQMSLTIQLAEEFLVRLRNATAALDPAFRAGEDKAATTTGGGGGGGGDVVPNGSSMFTDVVDVSYRAVRSKEESLGRHLAELRDEIEAFLDC